MDSTKEIINVMKRHGNVRRIDKAREESTSEEKYKYVAIMSYIGEAYKYSIDNGLTDVRKKYLELIKKVKQDFDNGTNPLKISLKINVLRLFVLDKQNLEIYQPDEPEHAYGSFQD